MRLEPIFILETHNQTNNSLPKFVRTDYASPSTKVDINSIDATTDLAFQLFWAEMYPKAM